MLETARFYVLANQQLKYYKIYNAKETDMSETIKNWTIIALCLHIIAAIWFASSPHRLGYWEAARDIAYDSVWIEYMGDCDCTDSFEGENNDL
jgi:cbb3-type cytochrome oxidase subunit 3